MNISEVIKQFQPDLTKESKAILDLFYNLKARSDKNNKAVERVLDKIALKQSQLDIKIDKTAEAVRLALFGDKKFLSETLSLEIPMEPQWFSEGAFAITNGVLTPKPQFGSDVNKKLIDLRTLTSRKETDFSITEDRVFIHKNVRYPYQELEIHLPASEGILYIAFDKPEKLSVLDRYGKELLDTAIRDSIALPVTLNSRSVVIRFEVNVNKSLKVKDLYIAEQAYQESAIVETKLIAVGQWLRQIAINTCDNYSDPSLDMSYQISINEGPFRDIRPLNKQKGVDIPSVLYIDGATHRISLVDSIQTDLGSAFTLDGLDSQDFIIDSAFRSKLGHDIGYPLGGSQSFQVSFWLEEVSNIKLTPGRALRANGELLEASTSEKVVKLKKGLNTLELTPLTWNQQENLLEWGVERLEGNTLHLKSRKDGSLATKQVIPEESIFLQLIGKTRDFYMDKYEPEVISIGKQRYILRDSHKDCHLLIRYKTRYVESVKVRVGLDKKSYITSMMIRGA